ncbi:hypothetical protein L593_14660 [Salinarchaeum sp. Harcht-Bsk1]|uniref:bactofilin family protein n=1 Tax=Salinarchaeum sp. Harcht-Bsk1 TaxID=1333523 RepID=UPI0003424602|nr:polymer-forming cytoskeletal protein [Salinarchaeum sp. Harcht-Bsk1]AGN02868.1 hypothetical protein L593_14660 [Salinarchaeum sp. Harcht-Bsk1]
MFADRRIFVLLTAALLVLVPVVGAVGVVTGQDTTRVDEGGTYSGGTVVIEGPIDGDVRVFAGTVIIQGDVDGDVQAFAGTVQVQGTISGNLQAAAGTVVVDGSVRGDVSVAAGTLAIDGSVGGNVRSASGTTQLGERSVVLGDLEYTGDLERLEGSRVLGSVDQRVALQIGPVLVPPLWGWFVTVFAMLAHAALGAVLLLAFPEYSRSVVDRIESDPLVTGAAGLGVFVGVPIVLVLLLLTIVGIPVSIAGLVIFGIVCWIGLVYGRFAVGYVLVRRAGRDSPWLGLGVGLVGVGVLTQLPYVGGLVQFVTLLLGLGALGVSGARELRRRRGEIDSDAEPTAADETAS